MSEAILFGIPEPRKKYLLAGATVGKNETEEVIRDAMHRLCFVLAASRRDYSAIPCFLLYHGDIAGSVLQNDQTVERGTGIAITIDDLADIGADYYALGHIHKPQKVGNLNAYYAGSIYPKNFGETHKAGFNIVTLEKAGSYGWDTDVERVDFPHPQNLKIEEWYPDLNLADDVTGKRVWYEITCKKEDRALINIDRILAELLDEGAVPGSRVTLHDIPVETVRAVEITAVKTPTEKFKVWAENSNIDTPASVIGKIKILENEIELSTVKCTGEWELVSIRLRGATGIKCGIKQDEIAINFDKYAPSLIALSGANGKGKTTLIENCHPHP
ncbi:MAG: hypothetical protein LBO67_04690 [Spirochaetaceae bacterium]|nr:hypothetical protein [Spirochaetaceae bacterium]